MIDTLMAVAWLAFMFEAAWYCYNAVYYRLMVRAMAPIIEARLREIFEEEPGDRSP